MTKIVGRPSRKMRPAHEAHVLEIAFAEFIENGFKGTSLDAIARRAGVSRVTLYRRYTDKIGLFMAVGAHAIERLNFDLQHIEPDGRSAEDVIALYLNTAIEAATTPEAIAIVRLAIAERDQFPEMALAVRQSRLEFLQPLAAYIETLDSDGVIRLDIASIEAAEKLIELGYSMFHTMLIGPVGLADRQEAIKRAAAQFLNAFPGTGEARAAIGAEDRQMPI